MLLYGPRYYALIYLIPFSFLLILFEPLMAQINCCMLKKKLKHDRDSDSHDYPSSQTNSHRHHDREVYKHQHRQTHRSYSSTLSSRDLQDDRLRGTILNSFFLIFMCNLIIFIFLEATRSPCLGEIYIIRWSVDNLFGVVRKSTSYSSLNNTNSLSSSSSSLSISSTGAKKQKQKVRPCLIWKTNPIQVLLMARFDGIYVTDPDFRYGSLSPDYVRRRLLSVYPKKAFGIRRSIAAKPKTNRPVTMTNTHLVLMPVTVDENTKWNKLVPEFFSKDDMAYINKLLLEIFLEENAQQDNNIRDHFISNNDDDNDDASLSTTRSFFSNQYVSSPSSSSLTKINIVGNKNFKSEVRVENIILISYIFVFCFR
jgi:hypothetical protein